MILSNRKNIARSLVSALTGALLMMTGILAHAQSANLRLMPLGDSITGGAQSSTLNGYRGPLYNELASQGDTLDFVGSLRGGTMSDPDEEGHYGYRIDQIASLVNGVLATYRPNIITLHIGSNDLNGNYQVSTAPARLASLIDQIISVDPDATLLVAQLICNANATTESNIVAYNNQIPGIVQARANAGKHVYMVSMSSLNTGDLSDGLHPNDGGYQKMADAWDAAIQHVIAAGWIKPPSTGASPFAGKTITLQAWSNGLYVTADNAGASPLVASRPSPFIGAGSWEEFKVVDLGNGFAAFQSLANGRYVSDGGGSGQLTAFSTSPGVGPGSWEGFQIIYEGNGSYALLAQANSMFVSAANSTSPLVANRSTAYVGSNSWETFNIVAH